MAEETLAVLNTMELLRCSHILDRGVFHYRRIEEVGQQLPTGPVHLVAELCYHGRSLVEVVRGISLWLRSEENIGALADAAFIDMVDHLRKTATWIEKWQIEPKSPEEHAKFSAIRSLDRKKWSVYYPDGKETIALYRRGDALAENSISFFAKLMHADEYSILGVHELADEGLPAYSYRLAQFWQKDFRHEVFLLYCRFPNITSFYEAHFIAFPFDFHRSPYDEHQEAGSG